ncbi:uncharacterized protein [Dendropsophus ebraccatus]|uniref:uncharacterized protein n=1 Tax=Dendropsophus ebraccatus TaxID=150705 RepID=UPI003831C36D
MESGQRIVCKYKNIEDEQREENFDQFRNEFSLFLRCTGCGAGNLVGLDDLLGDLGSDVGQTTGDLLEAVEGLKRALGIDKVGLDLLCYLLGGFLASDCAKRLISSDVSSVGGNLNLVLCSKEEKLDVALTVRTLRDASCLLDDTLRIDAVLENLTGEAAEALAPAVKGVVSDLKKDPLLGPLLEALGCPVANLLDSLVNGGGNGPLPSFLGGGGGRKAGSLLTNFLRF